MIKMDIEKLKKLKEPRKRTLKKTMKKTMTLPVVLFAFLFFLGIKPVLTPLLAIILSSPLPLYLYFYPRYLEKKKKRKMEKELVPLLYQASSIASYRNTEKVLENISKEEGELAQEFKKTYKQIKTGSSVKKALQDMKARINSDLIERAVEVLIIGHETGCDLSKSLEETANEASKLHEMKRKRKVSATVEKYTLLLAGGLIVPVLLGSMISVINTLEIAPITELNIGLSQGVKQAVKKNSILGNQIYIALYSIIASIFVAYQEKEIEKTLIYISILLPLSLLLFNVAKSINVLELL